ncbi:MAG: ABC transporter permease [Cyclobacteriaceae bacterium]|nr:ABC transporter permease [Cyclobacteriaceae bacterium]
MKQLYQLFIVELKEYIREPGALFWSILFPILLALGLGMAFSGGGNQDRTIAVVCPSNCQGLALLPQTDTTVKIGNEKIGYTNFKFKHKDWNEAVLMLKQGKTSLVLMPSDVGELNYHFDPANADAKLSYLQLSDYFGKKPVNEAEIEILKQEGTRYVDFLVPGILAMGIMMSCMWGISYRTVDRRNKKLLRRMVATPMKKSFYVITQIASNILTGALEATLLVVVTHLVFNIKITGSFIALLLMFLAGNIFFSGLAWLVASRTSKTQIANGLINLVVMPMMIMSGIYFSYHNFPDFMIDIIKFLPLTILADNIRSIFIEGAGLGHVLTPFALLSGIGMVLFAIGIRVYKWY